MEHSQFQRPPKPSFRRRAYERLRRALVSRYDGWAVEPAMRYLPIIRMIDSPERPILEVGSGSSGLAPYIRRPIIGVDMSFEPPVHPLLTPIVGSATRLPFEDCSQWVVVSTDMLEHIAPHLRAQVVDELVRVTREQLIIGVPTGAGAEAQDCLLARLYVREHRAANPFLTEHVENGLPTRSDLERLVIAAVTGSGRQAEIRTIGNGNLWVREQVMRLWIKWARPVPQLIWIALNWLHPLLSRMNFGTCYRTIVVVRFSPPGM